MTFGSVRTPTFADFALQFVEVLMAELDIHGVEPPPFKRAFELTNCLHDQILPQVKAPLVIAVDDATVLSAAPGKRISTVPCAIGMATAVVSTRKGAGEMWAWRC